jgi:hypothetical protein
MRASLSILAVLLVASVFAPAARAQASVPVRRPVENLSGSYALFSASLTYRQPVSNSIRSSTSIQLQTSVLVPDRGEASLGGSSSLREGRNEFGTPVLGKAPGLNRGLGNVGSSRSTRSTRGSVRVRIIRLAEEEERQTGVGP